MCHGLLGGNQDHQLAFDFKSLLVDGTIAFQDFLSGFQIALLERIHRTHEGIFHHTAQHQHIIFYLLDFRFKCFSQHRFLNSSAKSDYILIQTARSRNLRCACLLDW